MPRGIRVILVDLMERLTSEGIDMELTDSEGQKWRLVMGGDEDGSIDLSIEEIPAWSVYIEGHFIGVAVNGNAGEAVREVFQNAGLTSMPEAVEVKAVGQDETFAVFTLEGEAYCVPLTQFVGEIVGTSNWITARQARRPEIDALMEEIKRLPKG